MKILKRGSTPLISSFTYSRDVICRHCSSLLTIDQDDIIMLNTRTLGHSGYSYPFKYKCGVCDQTNELKNVASNIQPKLYKYVIKKGNKPTLGNEEINEVNGKRPRKGNLDEDDK